MILVPKTARQHIVTKIVQDKLLIHLFTNEIKTNDDNLELSDLIEAEGNGYNPISVKKSDWNIEGDSANLPITRFSFTAPAGKIYGYFVTEGDKLVWIEQFKDAPFDLRNKGDTIDIEIAFKIN